MSIMRIQSIPTEKINPAPYNPRQDLQPGDPLYEKIRRSIEEFDLVEPLVWNQRSGNLVGGHQRLKILKRQGLKEVQCTVVDLSPERERILNLALNKAVGDWDEESLAQVFAELNTLPDIDLSISGFDDVEISDLLAEPDFIPVSEETQPRLDERKKATCPECGYEFRPW